MTTNLQGLSILQVRLDHAITLILDGDFEIRIECPFVYAADDYETMIVPDSPEAAQLAVVRSVLGATIDKSHVEGDGSLRISIRKGGEFRVPPDASFEAWTIRGPSGYLALCTPGGEVAYWEQA